MKKRGNLREINMEMTPPKNTRIEENKDDMHENKEEEKAEEEMKIKMKMEIKMKTG